MAEKAWRKSRLVLLWGAVAGCVAALVCLSGTRFWPAIAALVIYGGTAGAMAVFDHGWHRDRAGVGSLIRGILLLGLVWIPMIAIGWWAWPKPAKGAVALSSHTAGTPPALPSRSIPVVSPAKRPEPNPRPGLRASELQKPQALPLQTNPEPLMDRALIAIQHCHTFQQQSEERRNAAWQSVMDYDAIPDQSSENKRNFERRTERTVLRQNEMQYRQNYKDEFVQLMHELVRGGAKEQLPGLNDENAGFVGVAAYFCNDLRDTAWSYVDIQYHRGTISAAGVRRFIGRLRRIERSYPSPTAPPR